MKKDKLSLERLIEKLDWWRKIAHIGGGCKDRDICEQAYKQIKARLQPVPEEKKSENELLRKLLWVRHGCPFHCLYGDDGEMQCSCCGIDFKRASAEYIERRFIEINEPKMAQALRFFENQGKKESSDEKNGKKKVI